VVSTKSNVKKAKPIKPNLTQSNPIKSQSNPIFSKHVNPASPRGGVNLGQPSALTTHRPRPALLLFKVFRPVLRFKLCTAETQSSQVCFTHPAVDELLHRRMRMITDMVGVAVGNNLAVM